MPLIPLFLMLAITAAGCLPASSQDQRPNILYIFTDDLSYRGISAYPQAYPYVDTPNIDRLAETGIRFDHAYIGAKCSPSRIGQRCGRFQYATFVEGQADPHLATGNWFKDLRANGYYTGFIGKWHNGKGAESHGHGVSWDWSVVWDHGEKGHEPGKQASGGYYYDQYVMYHGADPVELGGYSTDRYNELTLDFITERGAEPGKPWFFWLCYAGVHSPYTPPDRHTGLYLDMEPTPIPADIFGPRPNMPSHMQNFTRWTPGKDGMPMRKGKTLDFFVKQQMQAARAIDDGVGLFLQRLEETGQLENTIIVFTSDQGYVWGHHGLKGKIWPYADAIKAPLLIANPKRFPAGTVCKSPVNGMDMVRTFHAWSNTQPSLRLHGRDITPLCREPQSSAVHAEWNKTPTMMCYTYNRYEPIEMAQKLKNGAWDSFAWTGAEGEKDDKKGKNGKKGKKNDEKATNNESSTVAASNGTGKDGDPLDHPNWFSLHNGTYKYIRYCHPNRIEELYDAEGDPDELNNLAVNPEHEETLREFRAALVERLTACDGEAFVDHIPEPLQR